MISDFKSEDDIILERFKNSKFLKYYKTFGERAPKINEVFIKKNQRFKVEQALSSFLFIDEVVKNTRKKALSTAIYQLASIINNKEDFRSFIAETISSNRNGHSDRDSNVIRLSATYHLKFFKMSDYISECFVDKEYVEFCRQWLDAGFMKDFACTMKNLSHNIHYSKEDSLDRNLAMIFNLSNVLNK